MLESEQQISITGKGNDADRISHLTESRGQALLKSVARSDPISPLQNTKSAKIPYHIIITSNL
jgi:hypothetical protein